MVHESIKIFRLYCGLSAETISEVTGIPLSRYKKIELGEIEPNEKETEKLAKLFNIETEDLLGGITDMSKFAIRQEIDDNLFASEEIKQSMRMMITELSAQEKKLILLIRNSDDSEKNLAEAINMLLEK